VDCVAETFHPEIAISWQRAPSESTGDSDKFEMLMMDSGVVTVDPEIGWKIRGILPPRRQESPRERREEKPVKESQIREFSSSLPPLCEPGVLAVEFFDFED
jgi:hypothetical protein